MEAARVLDSAAGSDPLTIGKRLRALRLRTPATRSPVTDPDAPGFLPLSQRELATLANKHLPEWRLSARRGNGTTAGARWGLTYAYISRIESGARRPSVTALRALAPVLGVTANEIEFGRQTDPEQAQLQARVEELERRLARVERERDQARQRVKMLRDELRQALR